MKTSEGDAEAKFHALFVAASRPLLAYALRRVTEPADAADVVAETFVVAWRRIHEVPAGGEARLWLFGVARRVLGNHRRGELRRSNLADRLRRELAELVVADPSDTVDDARVVRVALARLDADDQEILRLTCWEGLTPAEAAVVLRVPAGTARSRLHRARSRLRAELRLSGWDGERSVTAGHVADDERPLVQDLGGGR